MGWNEKKTMDGMAYYYNDETEEISYEKPARLRSDTEKSGDNYQWTWIPHPTYMWQPAKIIKKNDDGSTECQTRDKETVTIPADGMVRDPSTKGRQTKVEFWPLTLPSLKMLEDDLVMLSHVNPGSIIHNLRERYGKDELYTWVGASHSVLVSINPYKQLPLYGEDQIDFHRNKSPNREVPPHVFDIANDSYDSMLFDSVNQSILISGESGAGKTEATKQCLKFVAHIAGSETSVETKLLQANPVLEAFGNAKTIRNNNSSRFGKWMEVFFAPNQRSITGAKITNYLLEKSRLVHQQSAERNFHIFYQMAANSDASSKFEVGEATHYRYLNQGHKEKIEGIDDAADFDSTMKAMKDLEFTEEESQWVLQLAAFVLHLGNCTFSDEPLANNVRGSKLENKEPLGKAANFLEVEESDLEKTLLNRSILVRGETSVIPLDPAGARAGCDSLAKGVYGRLFDWLVQRVNVALEGQEGLFIGILDIFGFEIFENNSFEQLCINYANEKLQQLFNRSTFKEEEALYERENIPFKHVEFIDNQKVLDLIEVRPSGVLPLLDDECVMPEGNDDKFMAKLEQAHSGNDKFQTDKHRKLNNSLAFEICHYAGTVCYDASQFMDKNKDTFYDDCYRLCSRSKNKLTQAMFPALESRLQTRSLSSVFRDQLAKLMDKLNTTRTRFIRCIKPNDQMQADLFDSVLCMQQLRYSGVFEAVQIRKEGYPFRWTYEGFATRYRCINPKHKYQNKHDDPKALCKEILEASPQDFSEVQFGETMLLYRANEHRLLKLLRNLALETIIPRLQRIVRGFFPREFKRRFLKAEAAIRSARAKETDYEALKAAIENAEPTIGNMRNLFPDFPIRNRKEAEEHLAKLKQWVDMEAELEAILQKDPNTSYKEYWATKEKAEGLQNLPMTDKQKGLLQKVQTAVAECDVGKIDNEAKAAAHVVDRARMEKVIEDAKQFSHESQPLDECTRLLNLSEKDFVQEELKVAERDGDKKRSQHREIRLKEIELDENGSKYSDWTKFEKLRSPEDFAKAKMFGKTKLREGMFQSAKAPVPTSLTTIEDKQKKKIAVQMNKQLLSFTGEKKDPQGPESALASFLDTAGKGAAKGDQDLRREAFVQLMKHISGNQDETSSKKAWDALSLTCRFVKPTDDIENYVLMFLRKKSADNGKKYIAAINEQKYGGGSPPSAGGIENSLKEVEKLAETGSRFSLKAGEPSGPSSN